MKYIRSNGEVVEVSKMDSGHIQNAIRKIERDNDCHSRVYQYMALCLELEKREDIGIRIE